MRSFSVLLLATLLISCSKSEAPKPTPQGAAQAAAKETQAPIQMTLTSVPDKLKMDQNITFRVHATYQSGKAVTGAKLHGALVMMTMDMGQNEFDFSEKGNGDYEGSAKATMAGPWELKVMAEKDPLKAAKVFQLRVEE